MDVRGNHDFYGVPEFRSNENLFLAYSVYGPLLASLFDEFWRVYAFSYSIPSGSYLFIVMDFVPFVGINPPYGVFGRIRENQIRQLESILKTTEYQYNHTIIVSHYARVSESRCEL